MGSRLQARWRVLLATGVACLLAAPVAHTQDPAPPNTLPNDYITVLNWAKFPDGRRWGSTSGVVVDDDGAIWAIDRCGGNSCVDSDLDPILVFYESGRLRGSFGAGRFNSPHGLHVDGDGNVWVTDHGADPPNDRGHQVFKFSARGRLLLTLGEAGVAGNGPNHFNQPSAVVVSPDGDIFVADGHGPGTNARIVRFEADGTFVQEWGGPGSEDGQFDTPHALALDERGRLFVADRGNNRIQIFEQDGTWLESWTQFGRPSGLAIDAMDRLYVADSESRTNEGGYGHNPNVRRGIRIGRALDGIVTGFIPDLAERGETSGAEGLAVDAEGNIFGAEVGRGDLKKYLPR